MESTKANILIFPAASTLGNNCDNPLFWATTGLLGSLTSDGKDFTKWSRVLRDNSNNLFVCVSGRRDKYFSNETLRPFPADTDSDDNRLQSVKRPLKLTLLLGDAL